MAGTSTHHSNVIIGLEIFLVFLRLDLLRSPLKLRVAYSHASTGHAFLRHVVFRILSIIEQNRPRRSSSILVSRVAAILSSATQKDTIHCKVFLDTEHGYNISLRPIVSATKMLQRIVPNYSFAFVPFAYSLPAQRKAAQFGCKVFIERVRKATTTSTTMLMTTRRRQ